ncbi:CRISPR-associated endonuclease Cas3'' [Frankia sp. KB5]|uniref:CRISPR-associated endonuclease Cas3'' n=1 Tax=Frankia sp. KB5 TaxID=683318 RepID=UPI000A11FC04|nr:CRISPR-associated endonuclease Cas3'' [Frankia sp. KB5]ORT47882.1 CRISPR-associated endonuclease Cas3'' [Frankia sp. KB5]
MSFGGCSDPGAADGAATDRVDLWLWGKSRGLDEPYPLVWHLLDTGAMAEVLWREVIPDSVRLSVAAALGCSAEDAGRLVAFWAALHDIGKIIPGFQVQDRDAFSALTGYSSEGSRVPVGHDLATQQFLAQVLGDLGYAGGLMDDASSGRVAQLLGGHHGCFHEIKPQDEDPRMRRPEMGGAEWARQRRAVLAAVENVFGPPAAPAEVPPPAAAVICGLVILADWLVSQEDFLRHRQQHASRDGRWADLPGLRAHRADSMVAAVRLAADAGLGRLVLREGTFAEEFPAYPPNALQRSVAEMLPPLLSGPGLLLVMAPMGFGKTETALHAARLMGRSAGTAGVVVTLPTMATADQMFTRVEAYLRRRADPASSAAVTLLHSMAWLNRAYAPAPDHGEIVTGEGTMAEPGREGARTAASSWLRGAKKGLLAPGGVGTIDQALLTVLPVRHNVLRMLGLAGKVLVVDEVHAYDPYMQYLLARLLTWLGALRVPVVLLSATVPEEVAKRLVRAYLLGARGCRYRTSIEVPYPGWIYADGTTARVTPTSFEMDPSTLALDLVDVPLTTAGEDGDPSEGRPLSGSVDRRAALQTLLAPILRDGGTAMVVCTTVAEAQQTFTALRTWCADTADPARRPTVTLLHARMPARVREARTDTVTTEFGREVGKRPRAAILVATQVAEQSLDVDFDLVISDLAPVAQLLQRAGRCHRHPQVDEAGKRPAWAAGGPRLAVLVPRREGGEFVLPKRWLRIYNRALLRRTYELLEQRHPAPVRIPADVQPMMDKVYDESFLVDPPDDEVARIMEDEAARGIAAVAAIQSPHNVLALERLTKREIDEDQISTRLGAPSVRVVCCYVDADGHRWLDRACTMLLPLEGTGPKKRFTPEQVRAVLSESIPMRDGPWRHADRSLTAPPETWTADPTLRDLVLLPHVLGADSKPQPVAVGSRFFLLDDSLGLLG